MKSRTIILSAESESIRYLMEKDSRFAGLVELLGPIEYETEIPPYEFVVQTIIGQMLSNRVADVIGSRLCKLCGARVLPEVIEAMPPDTLREIGISRSKVNYIKSFTQAVLSGELNLEELAGLDDKEAMKRLTAVKGIGNWSAKMYLLFVLDRPDILPFEDGAFLQSYAWLYHTRLLDRQHVEKRCKKWKPYSSYAARYLYQALDRGLVKSSGH